MTAALEGVSGQQHAPAALTPGKDPVPILQEAGWAPGPVPILGVRILHTLRDTNICLCLREIPFQMTASLCEGDEKLI